MLLGISLALVLATRRGKKYGIIFEDLLIIGGFALLVALPCGSLTYALVTFGIDGVWKNLISGNFAIFGGLVFYGSLIGGIIGSFIGIKVAKVDFVNAEKTVVPFIPIGHAIGRIGCIMAGCCYGMEYNGPLAIHYTNAITGVDTVKGYFPVQLLEGLLNILVSYLLIKLADKCNKKLQLLSVYLLFYAIVRFSMEFLRGDEIRGIYLSFSTSQWIAISLSVASVIYLFLSMKKSSKE